MKVKTKWQGGMAFNSVGESSGYDVTMDASGEVGGNDSGPRPMEMVLHGVAGCMGIDLCVIMRREMDKIESIEIDIEGDRRDTEPKSFKKVDLTVKIRGDVKAKVAQRAVDLSADKYCSAINSLNAEVITHLELNGERQ
ncbi:OsmC family protein [Salinicoccus halodurans]|uniref:Redox protein n=1 Tax=Salinicoccus halodurans TaxID=407035 RepID=A0A0F7HMN1_9STAP|nr:OsmC family protein [Salinicoccus halodurans]AKG74816.1 hypothetical protein AAT16_11820 [Salinicoccus halodurans]SFK69920.1 putative redox protein [Salinicoccus halodurans]